MRKTTLLLLVIAAGLVAWLYFVELKKESPRDRPAGESAPAFTFAAADIAKLTVTRGGETVALKRRGEDWWITAPRETRADSGAASALANAFAAVRIERTLPAAAERLADYGLDAPAVRVTAELSSGEKHTLRLGGRDFSGINVYAQMGGRDDVLLLSGGLLASADKSFDELRDKRLLHFSEDHLARLTLRATARLVLEKDEEGKWRFREPAAHRGKEARASSLIWALQDARAEEIFDDPPRQVTARLARPAAEVVLAMRDGNEVRVVVSDTVENSVYARTSAAPAVYRLPASLLDSLRTPPAELVVEPATPGKDGL